MGERRRRAVSAVSTACIMPRRRMALPKLKDIKWVTTDCYGTLIDWEKGILDAFTKEADRDGFTLRRAEVHRPLPRGPGRDHGGSYELYAEVLRRDRGQGRRRDRLGARALAGAVPARQRRPLGALSRGERGHGPARASATTSGSSPTSTTSCSASRAATCAPSSTSSSPRSRCAATSPTRPTSRRARGGSAARRAGSTSAAATTPTSRRC